MDTAIRDLSSGDADVRLRAARLLKDAASPDAAVPLAALVNDPRDEVQLEAIGAELNIFLAEKIVTRRRVGLIIEVRQAIEAESAFSSGPMAVGARPVPIEVLNALRRGARDDNRRVGLESLYAFGTLASQPTGDVRRALLRDSGPDLAALSGARDPALRFATLRVLGRLFARRAGDEPMDPGVGDAPIVLLNDRDEAVKAAAMEALGTIRYERAVQALTDLFRYYGKGVLAEAAFDALARIAHPSSAPIFAEQLAGRNTVMRGIAIEALARVGDRTKLAAIDMALTGERNEAVALTGAFATAMLANGPIDRIVAALSRPQLHDQAEQYLVELAPGRSSMFGAYARDPNPAIRAEVADALGVSDDPAALPIVESLQKDSDARVVRAAERAAARLRPRR